MTGSWKRWDCWCWLIVLGAWACSDVVRAAPSAVRLDEVDDDFHWMGEYHGKLHHGDGPARPVGLQVVALGDGQFQAVLLTGGLPGNGWNRADRRPLEGQRQGDVLNLTGDQLTIEIRNQRATVRNARQSASGTLVKVTRRSALEGLPAPPYSIVLFDGRDVRAFKNARVLDGLLQMGAELIPTYRSFQMHLEFLVPYMPAARSQGRGNSGVYLQSRYEVQILDSFGLPGLANECGGLYRQRAPDLNMAFPPLSWQTYDITFRPPIFDRCGQKCRNARLTLLHNGIPVHNDVEIAAKTGAGRPEGPEPLPIKLQDHGDPVQFRNIWLQELR